MGERAWRAWVLRAAVLWGVGAAGCVSGTEVDTAAVQDELINGTPTDERPEIGRISGCTATLVAPNVAITAAHCVGFVSRERSGDYGRFTVDMADGQSRSFTIERIKSYSNGQLGRDDVSLLRLSTPVPTSVATPTSISTRGARAGEQVTLFGYGCTSRRSNSGAFRKRKVTFAFETSRNLCPGDSGGPGVLGVDGPVFLINSGYYVGGGEDIFGEPWQLEVRLRGQIADWDNQLGSPEPVAEVRVTNATGARLWVACNGREAATCTGWRLLERDASVLITSPGRRLILDNQDFLPSARMSRVQVVAPAPNVTIFPNPASPFEPVGGEPDDPGSPPPDDPGAPDPREPAPPPPANEGAPRPDNGEAPEPPSPAPPPQCMGGATREQAAPMAGQLSGFVCEGRDSWLAFDLNPGDRLDLTAIFQNALGDLDMTLLGPDGQVLTWADSTSDHEFMRWTAQVSGRHTVRIFGADGMGNEDVLILADLRRNQGAPDPNPDPAPNPPGDNCREEAGERNDDQARATRIGAGRHEGGVCGADADWYFVNVQGAWAAVLTFDGPAGNLDLRAYDGQGSLSWLSRNNGSRELVRGIGPGYVEVYGANGATNVYTLTIE